MTPHQPSAGGRADTIPGFVVSWGELVWDVFDDARSERSLGGCASNVAIQLALLGHRCRLITRVGNDRWGHDALRLLAAAGVDTCWVQRDDELPTAATRVSCSGGEPQYRMLERMDWARIAVTESVLSGLSRCQAFVYGTLAQRSPAAQTALARVWEWLPGDCLKVCDMNLRGAQLPRELIELSARAADVVKMNDQEAVELGRSCGGDAVRWLLDEMNVRLVALTLGSAGCELYGAFGCVSAPALPLPESAVEGNAIGAGDAFCARLVHGLLKREPETLLAHECNVAAARIVGRRSATLIG